MCEKNEKLFFFFLFIELIEAYKKFNGIIYNLLSNTFNSWKIGLEILILEEISAIWS